MMTRKHFNALAEALLTHKPKGDEPRPMYDQWLACVYGVAKVCHESNPRFNANRFYIAVQLDYVDVPNSLKR